MTERSPGRWFLRVYAGRDPVTKRERYRTKTVRGGKRAAERALAALVTDVAKQRDPTQATLLDVINAWLANTEAERSPTTIKRYRNLLDNHITPALGNVPVHQLTAKHLDDFYRKLSKKLAPRTVVQAHAIIRAALNQALRWDWVPVNVALKARAPSVQQTDVEAPSIEVWRALGRVANPETQVLLVLAAATGARRGEIAGLQWGDFDGAKLTISRAVIPVDSGIEIRPTKTRQVRRMQLDPGTLKVLAGWRVLAEDRAARVECELGPESFVLSSDEAFRVALHPDTLSHWFARAREAAGVEGVRLHDLRHMHATMLIDAGIALPAVSKRLGHARTSTTIDIYAHATESAEEASAGATGDALWG